MKLTDECYHCLKRLVEHAAEIATDDHSLKRDIKAAGIAMLDKHYSKDKVSIVVATRIHDEIKRVSGNHDPYREIKDREIELARQMFDRASSYYDNSLSDLLKLAVLGNSMDFFKPIEAINQDDLARKINFYIDDSGLFESRLKKAEKVLYLADNAGEVYFDIPLFKHIRQLVKVKYVVKARPVQNDIKLDEIKKAGVEKDLIEVIDTGTATPGIDFSQASSQFIEEFETADLILAKGMGNYESLSEFPHTGRFFYCLKAKCRPVAESAGVPVDGFIAMLR